MNPLHSYLVQNGIGKNPELLDRIQMFKKRTLKKGDFLIREGQISHTISFIEKGQIRHFYNIEGKEFTRWVSLENNFVTAFVSFINGTPSSENLICIEDTVLLSMSRTEFFRLKEGFQEIQQLWVSSLEAEMAGYEQRVMQLITTNAEQRYLNFSQAYPEFIQKVPQKYIASMLGIEPRHLSRIRKKLASGH